MKIPFPSWASKTRLAKDIIALMPEHRVYVEPFCGAAAVFFAKPKSEREILNDKDERVIQMLKFLKNSTPEDLERLSRMDFRFSVRRWKELYESEPKDGLGKAYRNFYLTFWSFGGNPAAGPSRTAHQPNVDLSYFALRLQDAELFCKDAFEIIEKFDSEDTLFYLDPPYMEWCRRFKEEFDFERLAETVKNLRGKAILTIGTENAKLFDFMPYRRGYKMLSYLTSPGGKLKERREYLLASYEVEKARRGMAPDIGERPTREEQRELAERLIGDWYMVFQPKDVTFPFILVYHERGILLEEEREEIWNRLRNADPEERARIFKEHELWTAKASFEEISREAQKADDARGDVSAAVRKFLSREPETELNPEEILNLGNVHIDWRFGTHSTLQLDAKPKVEQILNFKRRKEKIDQLFGWTCDMPKVVIVTLTGKTIYPIRDRILENEPKDNILCQKKLVQPLVWLTLVSKTGKSFEVACPEDEATSLLPIFKAFEFEDEIFERTFLDKNMFYLVKIDSGRYLALLKRRRIYEAEPGKIGATKYTSARFIYKASGRYALGVQKTDYHEYFILETEVGRLKGRWGFQLIPSREEYRKAPEREFWMANHPPEQRPYILTHEFEEAFEKAVKEDVEMIWNDALLSVLKVKEKRFGFCPIMKVDEKQVLIGVVLTPYKLDRQGDILKEGTIEDACHRFLERGATIKVLHRDTVTPGKAVVVENAIVRSEGGATINGKFVRKGAWILGIKFKDPELWNKVKRGEFKGLSVGGWGKRRPIAGGVKDATAS